MNAELRPEDLSFLDRAEERFVFDAVIAAPRARVFAAISADPSTWTWYPDLSDAGYEGPGPHGVGSRRAVTMAGATYRETIVAWEEPSVWAYRVDESSVALAEALVEEWAVLEGDDDGHSVVRWTFALDPLPMFRDARDIAAEMMGSLFATAMQNLSDELNRPVGS